MTAADIDGDGFPDVIGTFAFDNRATWFKNTDGLANFSSGINIVDDDIGATWAAAGDFDGDGDLDVVVASYGYEDEGKYIGKFRRGAMFRPHPDSNSTLLAPLLQVQHDWKSLPTAEFFFSDTAAGVMFVLSPRIPILLRIATCSTAHPVCLLARRGVSQSCVPAY